MFPEPGQSTSFVEMEKKILTLWKEKKIFEKSVKQREGCPEYVFYEGPPTANGLPHPGHVLTRVVKDLFPRYKTMCGFHVHRKAGWDTHGLPVEIEVEKELGLKSKADIEKYGVEPFVEKCKESVFRYKKAWEEMTERIGFWIDLENPYITYTPEYIESVWWALKELWKQGLLYRSYKILPWCSRCGTGLSSHEVGLGYKRVKDPSVFVAFPVKGEEKLFLVAWTTTPWTLLSNVALAVGPEYEYAFVKTPEGERLVLAKERLSALFEEAEVEKVVSGKELIGLEYEPLFTFAKPEKPCYRVVGADFVSLEEGSGIVHIAPAFGEDDYEVGQREGLPVINLVNENGCFREEVTPWKGRFVKDCDKEIIKDLKRRGLLLKSGQYEHEYPFCWRCDTPLIYYARPAWFIRTTQVIEKILELNETIHWVPGHIQHGRFGKFLENNRDWALSRERYFGTPLPIWICEKCENQKAIGSLEELKAQPGYSLGEEVPDPHKPYIDEVTFTCEKCKGVMRRVPEVIDCWFDSGAMPFAQWGYPHRGKKEFERYFPADFISEAIDQTRGWFYTLLVINGILFGRSPYKNCLVLGLILGEDGKKMSKRLGNYVEPTEILDTVGADAMRWYFYSAAPSWTSIRFFPEAVRDAQRDFHIKIWNCYSFFAIYANLDGFDPKKEPVPVKERGELDRWILSELQRTIQGVRKHLDEYHIHPASQLLLQYVDKLSNWYIRRSRPRFWKSEEDKDKWSAYWTLYESLLTLAKLIAPFTPFLAEELYQNLLVIPLKEGKESVHLEDYPKVNESLLEEELMKKMDLAREIVNLGHSARMQAKMKVRQPLRRILVALADSSLVPQLKSLSSLIQEELNVKSLEILEKADQYVEYRLKPNFKVLGPKYGKKVKEIQKVLSQLDPKEAYHALESGGKLTLSLEEGDLELSREEVQVNMVAREGFAASSGSSGVVVLDLTIDEELRQEGLAREVVNRIQKTRKGKNLRYDAKIRTVLAAPKEIQQAVQRFRDYIAKETLSVELELRDSPSGQGDIYKIEGHSVEVFLEVVE